MRLCSTSISELQKVDPVADALAAQGCPFVFTTGYGRVGVPERLQRPRRRREALLA